LVEPVIMIALDSAEPWLIERWINDGTMPNLKRLRSKGGYGRLTSTADWLAGSPWPTFYTGTPPSDHGLYHFSQWRAEQMRLAPVGPGWLPLHPFWRSLSKTGHRVVAIDVPMTYPPEPFNGVEVYGWTTHDRLVRECAATSYPPSVMNLIYRELGFEPNPLGDEVWGIEHPLALLKLRDQLIRATYNVADLAKALMHRETWDLFMVSFAATHRGGHKLWDQSGSWGTKGAEELSHALRDIYIACDSAVGQLVKAAGDRVTIIVFSVHGMGPNVDRSELLPTMLERVLGTESKHSSLRRLIELVPGESRYLASMTQPLSSLYSLYAWRAQMSSKLVGINWASTPAFCIPADKEGYIRVNLRGRESAGIVDPNDYNQLYETIKDGLRTFVDADTGQRIVENVGRSDQIFKQGRRLNNLPDFIVQWASSPAANHRLVVSSRYGSIPLATPGRHPTGRSGNHRPEGFLVAVGDRFQPNSRIEGAHILDLAPAVCTLLNAPKPVEMGGNASSIIRHA
jgi:predicted AlkP superfamily phosphohydrolase/phosphomutase